MTWLRAATVLPGPQLPGLCSQTAVLCFLTAGVYWIPDALQLHRVSEDGALAFHSGMDCHLLHFHSGNREDERGNDFINENGRCRLIISVEGEPRGMLGVQIEPHTVFWGAAEGCFFPLCQTQRGFLGPLSLFPARMPFAQDILQWASISFTPPSSHPCENDALNFAILNSHFNPLLGISLDIVHQSSVAFPNEFGDLPPSAVP